MDRSGLQRTVLITHLNDARILRTLDSLCEQSVPPDQILVADGGSKPALLDQIKAHPAPGLQLLDAPGSVAASRAAALDHVTGDAVAFLDADETAPPHWLNALTTAIVTDGADVTGGPTRPARPAASRAERFVNAFDDWFYQQVVPADPARLPMGNSAWRTDLLRRIGGFDPRLDWAGEDYDVNLRARAVGARFQFAPDAWVHHDQSHLSTLRKLWRRQHKYAKGATMAYCKNGTLAERGRGAVRSLVGIVHPYSFLLAPAKLTGYLAGRRAWKRLAPIDRQDGAPEAKSRETSETIRTPQKGRHR